MTQQTFPSKKARVRLCEHAQRFLAEAVECAVLAGVDTIARHSFIKYSELPTARSIARFIEASRLGGCYGAPYQRNQAGSSA